jgi:hypothetical protein
MAPTLIHNEYMLIISVFFVHSSYGPMFGVGADLCIVNHCNTGMECYSNLSYNYNDPNLIHNQYCNIPHNHSGPQTYP